MDDRYLLISADGHAGPPAEVYRDHLDPAFRPSVLAYTARASLLTQQVALVARPTYDSGIVTSVSLGETPVTGIDGIYGPVPTASSSFFVALDERSWGDHLYEVTLDPSELPAEFGYGKAPVSAPREQFGTAVASDGDVLVVGAPHAADGGRVTVFRRHNRAWAIEAELRAPVPGASHPRQVPALLRRARPAPLRGC